MEELGRNCFLRCSDEMVGTCSCVTPSDVLEPTICLSTFCADIGLGLCFFRRRYDVFEVERTLFLNFSVDAEGVRTLGRFDDLEVERVLVFDGLVED